MLSKMREEAKLGGGSLTTGIEPAGEFFPAEPEHQVIPLPRLYRS
jgi:peptide methionine sulfoxide reductase MsrA